MEKVSDFVKKLMQDRQFKGGNVSQGFQRIINQIKNDPEIAQFLSDHRDELADNAVDRSASKLYEYVNVKNQIKDKKKSFAPGYLPQLVINDHLIDISYSASPEVIEKQRNQSLARRIRTVSMPKDIKNARIAKFEGADPNNPDPARFTALSMALSFIDEMKADPKTFHPGLYIYGPFGVGKTYLTGAIANELADNNIQTTMVHFPSFAVEMKSAITDNTVTEKLT